MSEYGRLYERVGHIRAQLKHICRVRKADIYRDVEIDANGRLVSYESASVTRLIDTNRLDAARASVTAVKAELDAAIYEWEQLEKEMERADDG